MKEKVPSIICSINNIPERHIVLDIPPEEIVKRIEPILPGTNAVIMNGTTGLVENPQFSKGTETLIRLVVAQKGLRRYGTGGNGLESIIDILGPGQAKLRFTLLSTMGGAAYEFFSGETEVGERLLAMKFVNLKHRPRIVNGVIDYSCLKTVADIKVNYWIGKTVDLIADLNIGKTSKSIKKSEMPKIEGLIDTITHLLNCGVKKIRILAHNGRIKDYKLVISPFYGYGMYDPNYSLKPIAPILTALLKIRGTFSADEEVEFVPDCLIASDSTSRVELKENTRFYTAETSKDLDAIKQFTDNLYKANPADDIVNDAAGAAHRDDCSKGPLLTKIQGHRLIGFLVAKELGNLFEIASNRQGSLLAIFQGEKVDDKIVAIENFIRYKIADKIAIFGKIALLFVNGNDTRAHRIMELAAANNVEIILPKKVVAAPVPEGMEEKDFIKQLKQN